MGLLFGAWGVFVFFLGFPTSEIQNMVVVLFIYIYIHIWGRCSIQRSRNPDQPGILKIAQRRREQYVNEEYCYKCRVSMFCGIGWSVSVQ